MAIADHARKPATAAQAAGEGLHRPQAPGPIVLGDILCYTVSPILARTMMPRLLKQVFAPQPVARAFVREVPPLPMVRPWQLGASAEIPAGEREAACNMFRPAVISAAATIALQPMR